MKESKIESEKFLSAKKEIRKDRIDKVRDLNNKKTVKNALLEKEISDLKKKYEEKVNKLINNNLVYVNN